MNPSKRKRLLGLGVGLLLCAALAVPVAMGRVSSEAADWDYADKGPTTWPGAFHNFCDGPQQSPIDIERVNAVADAGGRTLDLEYAKRADVSVFNNLHTVEAEVPEGAGKLIFDGKEYELKQFHFHTPSEHEISGFDHDVEMHLVHVAADGSIAVVGVLFRRGHANRPLQKVWRKLPGLNTTKHVEVHDLPLRQLVPKDVTAFHYVGSLTTPTCDEGVNWFVVGRIGQMGKGQIRKLRQIFSGKPFPSGNARPVQRFKVSVSEVAVHN